MKIFALRCISNRSLTDAVSKYGYSGSSNKRRLIAVSPDLEAHQQRRLAPPPRAKKLVVEAEKGLRFLVAYRGEIGESDQPSSIVNTAGAKLGY
jgi:hypothetical protein